MPLMMHIFTSSSTGAHSKRFCSLRSVTLKLYTQFLEKKEEIDYNQRIAVRRRYAKEEQISVLYVCVVFLSGFRQPSTFPEGGQRNGCIFLAETTSTMHSRRSFSRELDISAY